MSECTLKVLSSCNASFRTSRMLLTPAGIRSCPFSEKGLLSSNPGSTEYNLCKNIYGDNQGYVLHCI